MSEAEEDTGGAGRNVGLGRLVIGLGQGVALWALLLAFRDEAGWPHAQPALFAALVLPLLFAPIILLGGLGRVRPLVLGAWTVAAAAVLALFGLFDRLAAGGLDATVGPNPQVQTFAAGMVFVFIAHHLIVPADAARRPVPPYADYFDAAWKDAVQVLMSGLFVGVMWLALGVGAALFALIGLRGVGELFSRPWFAFPVTAMAFAAAVHLTDVRIGLIRGVRTVGLVLLAWLLPLATALVVAFLAALPFTGLAPLFATRSASVILLAATAGLIILINAAYQDGADTRPPAFLRWSVVAAAFALVPMMAIAAYAVSLRVGQHGLTPERVWLMVLCLVGGGYALGYAAAAALGARGWMKLLERVNVVMALVVLAALVALFTPVADPNRLSVADQVGRLMRGQVAPDQFDFRFLRYDAGRGGLSAFERLRALRGSPRNEAIARAAAAAASQGRYEAERPNPQVPATTPAQRFTAYPTGAALPAGFLSATDTERGNFRSDPRWECLSASDSLCDAYVFDIDGDREPEVLVTRNLGAIPDVTHFLVYRRTSPDHFSPASRLVIPCASNITLMRAGRLTLAPIQRQEVVVGPFRTQTEPLDPPVCTVTAAPP